MKTVRIAMLGSGFVAEFYMQGLENVNGQEVVLAYSRTRETAERLAARWGIPETSTDLAAVIAREDVDLFIVALPNFQHEEVCTRLAEAGRAIVCTKPLGRNEGEARRVATR